MYVAHLAQERYAPRSIDHIHDVLSAVLRTAVKWGHLQDNPARGPVVDRLPHGQYTRLLVDVLPPQRKQLAATAAACSRVSAHFGRTVLSFGRLTFRRTYSSWSHDKGVPGEVVAQLMRHANVDTTLNVYTQVLDGSLRAAVDKVGGELFTIVHRPESAGALTQ